MAYKIRMAAADDAAELLRIYAPFVTDTAVSFEYTVPSETEFAERIKNISADYPYLVYEEDDKITGYAYVHRYLERAAYQWDVEVTVYLEAQVQGRGVGLLLYEALEALLKKQGVKNLYACITAANTHSINFHKAAGYKIIGKFTNAGYKNGSWQDVVWMEKSIGTFEQLPEMPRKITELEQTEISSVLDRYK